MLEFRQSAFRKIFKGVDHQAIGIKDGHFRAGAGEGFHKTPVNQESGEEHSHYPVLETDGRGSAQRKAVLPLRQAGGFFAPQADPHQGVPGDIDADGLRRVGPHRDHAPIIGDGEDMQAGGLHHGNGDAPQGLDIAGG